MTKHAKQWLIAMPWEKVLRLNQAFCQAQNTSHQTKPNIYETARRLWEQSADRQMPLDEILDLCRKCHEMGPFVFNNANTFAAAGKELVAEWVKTLPPLEAQIVSSTISHYIAGLISKKELLKVLQYFEKTWVPAQSLLPLPKEKGRVEGELTSYRPERVQQ